MSPIKRKCKNCGSQMALIGSQNTKICSCGYTEEWKLDDGQDSVFGGMQTEDSNWESDSREIPQEV